MTPRTQPAVEAVEQLIDAANQTPAAQTSEPHTAAGRRLHARIFGLSDRMPDGAELDNLILAIEAEAAAPASPDVVEALETVRAALAALPAAPAARRDLTLADLLDTLRWIVKKDGSLPEKDSDRESRFIALWSSRLALSADKPEPSVQAEPAGLDVERLRRAICGYPSADPDHCRDEAEAIAAAYAEGEPE
jgi:hypothetical protein